MKSKYVLELKEYYEALFDEYGFERENVVGVLASVEIEEYNKKSLMALLRVVLNSDNVSEPTKVYMTNFRENMKEVSGGLTSKIGYTTLLKKISDDNDKLEADLGLLPRRLAYNMLDGRFEYVEAMKSINEKYGCAFGMRNNLMLRIDDKSIIKHMDSTDFFLKLKDLEMYLKDTFKRVEMTINNDPEFSGYFNYLLKTSDESDPTIVRDRERLLKFLNNEDIVTGYDDSNEFQ